MAARMSGTPGEDRDPSLEDPGLEDPGLEDPRIGGSRLDPASRRTLSGWLLRVGGLLACAVLPWGLGLRSLHAMGGDAALVLSLGGMVATLTATCRRERIGGGSLNHWDQALAFNGASLLLHVVLRWS